MSTAERPIVAVPPSHRIEVTRHIPALRQSELLLDVPQQVEASRVNRHVADLYRDARADRLGTPRLGKAKALLRQFAHLVLFLNLNVVDAHGPHLGRVHAVVHLQARRQLQRRFQFGQKVADGEPDGPARIQATRVVRIFRLQRQLPAMVACLPQHLPHSSRNVFSSDYYHIVSPFLSVVLLLWVYWRVRPRSRLFSGGFRFVRCAGIRFRLWFRLHNRHLLVRHLNRLNLQLVLTLAPV